MSTGDLATKFDKLKCSFTRLASDSILAKHYGVKMCLHGYDTEMDLDPNYQKVVLDYLDNYKLIEETVTEQDKNIPGYQGINPNYGGDAGISFEAVYAELANATILTTVGSVTTYDNGIIVTVDTTTPGTEIIILSGATPDGLPLTKTIVSDLVDTTVCDVVTYSGTISYIYDTCCIESDQVLKFTMTDFEYTSSSACQYSISGLSNPFGPIVFTAPQTTAAGIVAELTAAVYGGADKVWSVVDSCKIQLTQASLLPVPLEMSACRFKRWYVPVEMLVATSGPFFTTWNDATIVNNDNFKPLASNAHYYNGMYHQTGSLWDNASIGDMFRMTFAAGDNGVSGYDNRGINNIGSYIAGTAESWKFWKQQLVQHCEYGLTTKGICGVVGIVDGDLGVLSSSGQTYTNNAFLYYDIPCDIEMRDTSYNELSSTYVTSTGDNEWKFNANDPLEPPIPVLGSNWTRDDIGLTNHFSSFVQESNTGTMIVTPSYSTTVGSTNFGSDCIHPSLTTITTSTENTTITEET